VAEGHDLDRLVVLAARGRVQQIEEQGEHCREDREQHEVPILNAACGDTTLAIIPQDAAASWCCCPVDGTEGF